MNYEGTSLAGGCQVRDARRWAPGAQSVLGSGDCVLGFSPAPSPEYPAPVFQAPSPRWPCETGRLRPGWAFWVLLVVVALAPAAWAAAGRANSLQVLQGKLLVVPGKGPLLRTSEKDQPLSAITPYLLHTLQDKRLANREVRVEGTRKPDGTFEVQWLYTLRNGKLYRIRYFCNLCNLEALGPGDCVCCQQPTELEEIPISANSEL